MFKKIIVFSFFIVTLAYLPSHAGLSCESLFKSRNALSTAEVLKSHLKQFPLSSKTKVKDLIFAGTITELDQSGKVIDGTRPYVEVIRRSRGKLEMNIFSAFNYRFGQVFRYRVILRPTYTSDKLTIVYKGSERNKGLQNYAVTLKAGQLTGFVKKNQEYYGGREYVFDENMLNNPIFQELANESIK